VARRDQLFPVGDADVKRTRLENLDLTDHVWMGRSEPYEAYDAAPDLAAVLSPPFLLRCW